MSFPSFCSSLCLEEGSESSHLLSFAEKANPVLVRGPIEVKNEVKNLKRLAWSGLEKVASSTKTEERTPSFYCVTQMEMERVWKVNFL